MHHLAAQRAGTGLGQNPVAKPGSGEAADKNSAARQFRDPTDRPYRIDRGDFGLQGIENAGHRDLLLFADYRF